MSEHGIDAPEARLTPRDQAMREIYAHREQVIRDEVRRGFEAEDQSDEPEQVERRRAVAQPRAAEAAVRTIPALRTTHGQRICSPGHGMSCSRRSSGRPMRT
jgi:hypothetical protein